MRDTIDMAREATKDREGSIDWVFSDEELERFAALVRADEREACAKVCEEIYTGEEACGDWPTPEMCAAAIRARSLSRGQA
jgi:hypothetical protein